MENKSKMKIVLTEMIKETIKKWDKQDIYAVSLYVYDDYDNPYDPVVVLGYNTIERYKSQIKRASGESEAKWNYAFWLQNKELEFGQGETKELVKEWIEENGYTYYDRHREFDEESYEGLTEKFVSVLIEIVKELHHSGFIKEQFDKEIPVLIHELEYYELILEQNIEANSSELIEESFRKFCLGED